ncbi:hypothetical protein JXA85_06250, partial [Candidatus Woesearchaeota archaeon]|nr:hypothetical protein [Candidatus Woesearchaeota archaeon]
MSDLEQGFYGFLNRHPEIRAAFDLLNIRALARAFMREEHIDGNHLEAVVAMIRRTDIKPIVSSADRKMFNEIKIATRDEIVILDYGKSKGIVERIEHIVSKFDYDKNETLKVVIGSHSVKIIVDSSKAGFVKEQLGRGNLLKEYRHTSEISLLFSSRALEEKGIVAYIASELLLGG